jgi:hypothetical protein
MACLAPRGITPPFTYQVPVAPVSVSAPASVAVVVGCTAASVEPGSVALLVYSWILLQISRSPSRERSTRRGIGGRPTCPARGAIGLETRPQRERPWPEDLPGGVGLGRYQATLSGFLVRRPLIPVVGDRGVEPRLCRASRPGWCAGTSPSVPGLAAPGTPSHERSEPMRGNTSSAGLLTHQRLPQHTHPSL